MRWSVFLYVFYPPIWMLTKSESLTAFDKKEVRHHAEHEYNKEHRCHNQVDDGSHHEADRASHECG